MAKTIGIIGGSGLYEIEGLQAIEQVVLDTPFGAPSDAYTVGRLGDAKLVFLPRHGRGHRLMPSEINFRANIYGMKKLGVEWVISLSAVGSMREEVKPGDFVMVDQFVDRTRHRASTFFGDGIVGHVAFADPTCATLAKALAQSAAAVGITVHPKGTYVCMEGPQFSTRAESRIYRSWGVDVIGMTNLPEAKLAREAELCYATVALVTDYDCWHESEEDVSIQAILAIMKKNVEAAKKLVAKVAPAIEAQRSCGCKEAARHAILTDRAAIPAETRKHVDLLFGKYL